MADLNPSIITDDLKDKFDGALKEVSGDLYQLGKTDGEKYFYIPSLERHEGLVTFILNPTIQVTLKKIKALL